MAIRELVAQAWNGLGNLLLENKGDPKAAELAYREGLAIAEGNENRAFLNANIAYALGLFLGAPQGAQEHIRLALEKDGLTSAGRALLSAIPTLDNLDESAWTALFSAIGRAVESGDSTLWTTHLDDLQKLLWFAIANNRGEALRQWMLDADYPLKQAPLYHAVVAAIDDEDHLLSINPETRAPAERIYKGIARLLKLYAHAPKTKHPQSKSPL